MLADLLIKNAAELLTCKPNRKNKPKIKDELKDLGIIKDGAVAVKDGMIVFVGNNKELIAAKISAKKTIDASNKLVMPGFVDCHTHAIFAGSRENEFLKKLAGKSYLEILKEGGGILSTVEQTRKASKDELLKIALKNFNGMLEHGTTTVEVKSGYGLRFEDEKKILEVADLVSKKLPLDVVKTYLGAHAVPKDVSKEEYLKEVLSSLAKISKINKIKNKNNNIDNRYYNLAEFCDVFCEKGVFSVDETRKILSAAKKLGFKLKLHAEQHNDLGSAELAAQLNVVSADHLDNVSDGGIKALAKSGVGGTGVVSVLLPGVPFYLMDEKYAPARNMIDAGCAIAIASDFNPGSCPCYNMQLMITLACLKMKVLPAEAINSATINAAFAVDRADSIGSLEVGKKADIIVLDIDNHSKLPYFFGANLVEKVVKDGKVVVIK